MEKRVWLLTGLMLFSVGFMTGRQVYAQDTLAFTYDEISGDFKEVDSVEYADYVDSALMTPFKFTGPPSACYPLSEIGQVIGQVYEARIIYDRDDIEYTLNGKVLFSVLNKDEEFIKGHTCGGSLIKQFLLWLPLRSQGGKVIGVHPATEVSIEPAKEKNKIKVTLGVDPDDFIEGGQVCGRVPC